MKTDSYNDWEYFVTAVMLASGSDIWQPTGTTNKTIAKDTEKDGTTDK